MFAALLGIVALFGGAAALPGLHPVTFVTRLPAGLVADAEAAVAAGTAMDKALFVATPLPASLQQWISDKGFKCSSGLGATTCKMTADDILAHLGCGLGGSGDACVMPAALDASNDVLWVETPHSARKTAAMQTPVRGAGQPPMVTPQSVRQRYSVPDGLCGEGRSVGVGEFQDDASYTEGDIDGYDAGVGVAVHQPVRKEGPFYNQSTGDEEGLDIEMVEGLATCASKTYYTVATWMGAFQALVLGEAAPPEFISLSYGWNEFQQCSIVTCASNFTSPMLTQRISAGFALLAGRGVTIVAASGDSGANGRTNMDCTSTTPPVGYAVRAVMPAASPYVLAISSTSFHAGTTYAAGDKDTPPACANATSFPCWKTATAERFCWNGNADGCQYTGGGGFSMVLLPAPWQVATCAMFTDSQEAVRPQAGQWAPWGACYPLFSAVGTSGLVMIAGEWVPLAGTSMSSPIAAALLAMLVGEVGAPATFMGPTLHAMGRECAPCFMRDMKVASAVSNCTEGGCCPQGYGAVVPDGADSPTWDPTTGFGTLNFTAAAAWLKARGF